MADTNEPTEVLSMRLPASKAADFKKLAAADGREPAEQLEYLAVEALIAAGLLPQKEVEVHRLRESLIRRFLARAEEISAKRRERTSRRKSLAKSCMTRSGLATMKNIRGFAISGQFGHRSDAVSSFGCNCELARSTPCRNLTYRFLLLPFTCSLLKMGRTRLTIRSRRERPPSFTCASKFPDVYFPYIRH